MSDTQVDPYFQGRDAFWEGYCSSDNPYELGTDEHRHWEYGYYDSVDAADEEEDY